MECATSFPMFPTVKMMNGNMEDGIMKKYSIVFAALFIAAAACTSPEAEVVERNESAMGIIRAKVDDVISKADFTVPVDNKVNFVWNVDDKVGIRVAKKAGTPVTRVGTVTAIDGDGVATITYDLGTGDSAATDIQGAWYPYIEGQSADLAAIPTVQNYANGHVSIPLRATSASVAAASTDASVLVFEPYLDYSVLGYRLQLGNAARTIKSITVGSYSLTNINVGLTSTVQTFYLVLPPAAATSITATIIANDGSNDLEYKRTKSSYTAEAGKVKAMPIISDLDDTGKLRWVLGTSNSYFPTTMLTQSILRSEPDFATLETDGAHGTLSGIITNHDGYVTVTTKEKSSKYRGDFATIWYSGHVYYADNTPQYTRSNNSDAERIYLHSGNYPIIAVKMSNLEKLLKGSTESGYYGATSYSRLRFTIDSKNGSGVTENGGIRYVDGPEWDSKNVIGNTTTWSAEPKVPGDDNLIYYFNLATEKFNIGGSQALFPNTKSVSVYKFNFRVADIVGVSSAPEFNVYWIGAFSNIAELEAFASEH